MGEFVFKVGVSKTSINGDRISCSVLEAEVYAESESDARKIMATEYPEYTVDTIELIGPSDDEDD